MVTTAIIPWHAMAMGQSGPLLGGRREQRRAEGPGPRRCRLLSQRPLLLELGHRSLSGEAALQVPTRRDVSVQLNSGDRQPATARSAHDTHLSDSSLASNSCLFSLISRCTLSSISRNYSVVSTSSAVCHVTTRIPSLPLGGAAPP